MLDKIKNLINLNNKDLGELSTDEMIELLTKLNKYLRCLDESKNVIEENMATTGGLISPTKEVQTKILEYLVQNMKKVQDQKAKAAMFYYTLLNLHMFSDGNGRTARFMYDLISGELSEDNIIFYFHKDSKKIENPRNDLESFKGILDIYDVNQIPDELLGKQFDFIPQNILDNYCWITVGHIDSYPSTDTIIPKSVLEELSQKELQNLDKILKDGYNMKLCPSGVAMLYVSNKKGQLDKWIEKNNSDLSQGIGLKGRLNFSVYRNPGMIADWNADDFRDVISMGNEVKYARLKCLIDIFAEPEKYINIDTGNTYADEILGFSNNKESEDVIKR